MPNTMTEERLRDLECDRLMAAGLCMGATTIAATRMAAHIPAAARMFELDGAIAIMAPIALLATLIIGAIAFIIATDQKSRLAAGILTAVGAGSMAAAVPFLRQCLALYVPDTTAAWAAAVTAFTAYGLCASIAIQDQKPSGRHAAFSAAITVFALLQAAMDGSGVFSMILAAMGMLFFTLWRAPTAS